MILDENVNTGWTNDQKQRVFKEIENRKKIGKVWLATGMVDIKLLHVIENIDDTALTSLKLNETFIYLFPITAEMINVIIRIIKYTRLEELDLRQCNLSEEHFEQLLTTNSEVKHSHKEKHMTTILCNVTF